MIYIYMYIRKYVKFDINGAEEFDGSYFMFSWWLKSNKSNWDGKI